MIWYLLNIFVLILVWNLPVNECKTTIDECENIRKKRLCIVGTINWVILSGCRAWSIGDDTYQYKVGHYDISRNLSWGEIIHDIYTKYFTGLDSWKDDSVIKGPGYAVFEKSVSYVAGDNYNVYLLFVAIAFFVPVGIFLYRYSENVCISYIVFSTLFYSFFAITGIKQTLATVLVVFIGSNYIKENKLINFLIIVFVGVLIHKSCICFLPFYWISKLKINRLNLCIWGLGILVVYIGRDLFWRIAQKFFGYSTFVQTETAHAGAFVYLLLLVALVIIIMGERIASDDISGMARISCNAVLMSAALSATLLINESAMRVVQYYSIFLMCLLPRISTTVFSERRDRMIFNVVSSATMIVLFVLNRPVYMFFWQG